MFAIDIDGVVADSEPFLVKELEMFTGEEFNPPNPRTYDFRDGFNNLSLEHCLAVIDYTLLNYSDIIPVCEYKRTYLALALLQYKYGKVHFITARSSKLWIPTDNWLKQHFGFLNYDLYNVGHDTDKELWMEKHNLKVIVEDRLQTVNNLQNSYNKAYLVKRPWNEGRFINSKVSHVYDLLDAVEQHL